MVSAQAFRKVLLSFVLVFAVLWGGVCVRMWGGMVSVAVSWRSWLQGDKR